METICGLFGKTRQAWYVDRWSSEEASLRDAIVIKSVKEIREQMPRLGTRKLHYLLAATLQKHGITIGRDKLFDLLLEYGLLVRRRKRKYVRTTDSNHPFKKYPNLIRELEPQRPNHLWVSDITYISLVEGFCYLSLVTDAYSKKIMGYCLYPSLKKEGPIEALEMALSSLPGKAQDTFIHHSDRGLQYGCTEYTTLLLNYNISISMTEKSDPYENAIAERVNGILKQEFILDKDFDLFDHAHLAVQNAVNTYNQLRPHASCNYLTPEQAHLQNGFLPSRWRRKKEEDHEV